MIIAITIYAFIDVRDLHEIETYCERKNKYACEVSTP